MKEYLITLPALRDYFESIDDNKALMSRIGIRLKDMDLGFTEFVSSGNINHWKIYCTEEQAVLLIVLGAGQWKLSTE